MPLPTSKLPRKDEKAPVTIDVGKRQRIIQIGVGLALTTVLAIWWLSRPSAQMTKVLEMQRELTAKTQEKITPEERKQRFADLRAEQEKLTPEEQKAARKEMGQQFQAKASADAIAYMQMTPAERLKIIDQKIAREQEFQKKRQAGGVAPGGGPANGGAPNGVVMGANAGGRGPGAPAAGGATAPAGGAVPAGQPAPEGVPLTAEDRDSRRREMLIHMPPQARAGFDQMRIDMATRRAQLGLPNPTPPVGRPAPR